jgi:RNA polymerase sigma factor for flagellar operon FliA
MSEKKSTKKTGDRPGKDKPKKKDGPLKATVGRRASPAPAAGAADLPSELVELWHGFKIDGSQKAREQLILHYAPLVKYVAARVGAGLPGTIEQADLASYGLFGLIDALEKFDLERGVKFETYAIPRIKGAIMDELRALDWVPRSVRLKAREVEKAYTEIEVREKRSPTEQEVADRLGVSVAELHEVVTQISFVSVMALDEVLPVGADRGETISLLDILADTGTTDPEVGVEDQETRTFLAAAINELSQREKLVLTLYYFEGMTLAEIGDILGVTESRVCQIHLKAVARLRSYFTETDEAI